MTTAHSSLPIETSNWLKSKAAASFGASAFDVDFEDSTSDLAEQHLNIRGGCVIKQLPVRLLKSAAKFAMQINPANSSVVGPVALVEGLSGEMLEIARLTVSSAKYWGPTPRVLTVSFMESADATLRARILDHMNAWSHCCGIRFRETDSVGQVRITRQAQGYWSYLGTDVALIPDDEPTMSLEGFTMSTPDSEFRRVVRHEAGHTLGFQHEHMRKELIARIDRQKAYAYFRATQGWDRATVDAQVLKPLDQESIMGTPPDQTSIMCYQLPDSILKPGAESISGGADINSTDCEFAGILYPKRKPNVPKGIVHASPGFAQTWSASKDVALEKAFAAFS